MTTAVRGNASGFAAGTIFMALFSIAWTNIGLAGLHGTQVIRIVTLAISISLLTSGGTLLRSSRQLSRTVKQSRRTVRVWFAITFISELAFIAIAKVASNVSHHLELFFPVMALIVGTHFFPLAYAFRVKVYFITGTLLCLLSLVTISFVPTHGTFLHEPIDIWRTLVGLGSTVILWVAALVTWLKGRVILEALRSEA